MVNYNIGIIQKNSLDSRKFKKIGTNLSLQNCLRIAKSEGHKYVAIEPDSSSKNNNGINITGTCFSGDSYDPIKEADSGTYQVFNVPDADCKTDDCLKNNSKSVLVNEIKQIQKQIDNKESSLDDVKVKLFAIENGIPMSDANQKWRLQQEQAKIKTQSAELQQKVNTLQQHLHSLETASSSANMQLADKNRLLATVNSNINQSTTKLGTINDQINTITQDIYTNNREYENKEQIVKALKALVIVFFILCLVMVVYYGVKFASSNYPDSFAGFNNTMSNWGAQNLNPFA